MEIFYTKIIESIIVVTILVVTRNIVNRLIDKTTIDKLIQKSRTQLVKRVIHLIILIIGFTLIMIIWGVKQSDLAVFMGSVLTIVGVAFFAQWSFLSNITSSIILFFGHSVKIGDHI